MNTALIEALYATPHTFTFAQVVDVLEHSARIEGKARQGGHLAPMGLGTDPRNEALRLTAGFEMRFHAGAITYLRRNSSAAEQRPELSVNFFGLGGPDGPLPEPFIEMVLAQLRARDDGAADFLDIFQHRLLSYVYRAENEFRFAAPFLPPASSAMMPALRAILGRQQGNPDTLLDPILLANAGLVAQQRHSISGLKSLLHTQFGAPVRARQFLGRWLNLPSQLQTVLGKHGQNDILGDNAVLGSRAWDQNGAVEITLGPLDFGLYLDLLPDGAQHDALCRICAYYLGSHIVCHLVLELDAVPDGQRETDNMLLGKPGCRLGFTTWAMASRPESRQCPAVPLRAERRVTLILNDGTSAEREMQ